MVRSSTPPPAPALPAELSPVVQMTDRVAGGEGDSQCIANAQAKMREAVERDVALEKRRALFENALALLVDDDEAKPQSEEQERVQELQCYANYGAGVCLMRDLCSAHAFVFK